MNMQQTVFVAVETTGPSSNSSSHEDDVSLNCSITNEGLSVPCMSAADVEACIEMLNSHPGPLLFTNGEIFRQSEILSWNELRLTREPVCLIKLKRENKIKSCYGVYLGNDYTLTACHTFEFARLYDAYVFFPTTDFVLIYEAELPKEQHMFHDKDQCLVKLLGQTDVLGKGLLNRICAPGKNEDLYFYTFDSQGNRQVHTCKDITHPSAMNEKSQRNELLMSTAGQPGESGNPVFSLRSKRCVGIYRGITKSKKGCASKIDSKQLLEHTTLLNANPSCLNMLYSIYSILKTGFFCWRALNNQTSADDSE
ncbi:uncharacterized protein LOC131533009 [Onychostoma macrolepis]|uniref:uncharacterized protein LOC131533009 n=1 Tax=Onychostoma macrolepis TaxID=369639 RepID=UPI00272B9D74|nr:uncharacterized protein LOC131533009 [Onychostoma macrolepis]